MIQAKNIKKSFGDKTVLSNITMDIKGGMIYGLLGPSGAGKTTLIRILTGQLAADGGEASILEKNSSSLTGGDRKQIGIMMDSFGVYERLSCLDNLKIFASIHNIPLETVKETLREVGLEGAMKTPAAKLSKGMRGRLQLARVFMQEPKVIFLDEPTSGLDPASTEAIHEMILRKKKAGCTVFLTTHNMGEAAKLCDHVALLNEGTIVEEGEPKEVCRRYNHQNRILIHYHDGREVALPENEESGEIIKKGLSEGSIETIHTTEPDLESVFMELTGRNLKEA